MFFERLQLQQDRNIFLAIITILVIIGLLFIYSASSIYALENFGTAHHFVKSQFVGLLIGFFLLVLMYMLPISLLQTLSPFLFFSSLGLTSLTLFPYLSQTIHGSSRWLVLGGFSFQPSELLKVTLIMYLANFLSKKERSTGSFSHVFLPFLCILAATSFVLLKQPDFGMTVTLALTAFILFFIIHFNFKKMLLTMLGLIPVVTLLIYMKQYRLQRILTFLNPWKDPLGAGFQIIQSLIAIGSGSWMGAGVSHSKQKFFYLPMQHTDFIFSIIAEEAGFIGSALIIFLYLLFLYFGMRIVWQLRNNFCILLCMGFVLIISLQALINLGVTSDLLPTKGIGLPFISYGKSALICNLMMIGLIMNCVKEMR